MVSRPILKTGSKISAISSKRFVDNKTRPMLTVLFTIKMVASNLSGLSSNPLICFALNSFSRSISIMSFLTKEKNEISEADMKAEIPSKISILESNPIIINQSFVGIFPI